MYRFRRVIRPHEHLWDFCEDFWFLYYCVLEVVDLKLRLKSLWLMEMLRVVVLLWYTCSSNVSAADPSALCHMATSTLHHAVIAASCSSLLLFGFHSGSTQIHASCARAEPVCRCPVLAAGPPRSSNNDGTRWPSWQTPPTMTSALRPVRSLIWLGVPMADLRRHFSIRFFDGDRVWLNKVTKRFAGIYISAVSPLQHNEHHKSAAACHVWPGSTRLIKMWSVHKRNVLRIIWWIKSTSGSGFSASSDGFNYGAPGCAVSVAALLILSKKDICLLVCTRLQSAVAGLLPVCFSK